MPGLSKHKAHKAQILLQLWKGLCPGFLRVLEVIAEALKFIPAALASDFCNDLLPTL